MTASTAWFEEWQEEHVGREELVRHSTCLELASSFWIPVSLYNWAQSRVHCNTYTIQYTDTLFLNFWKRVGFDFWLSVTALPLIGAFNRWIRCVRFKTFLPGVPRLVWKQKGCYTHSWYLVCTHTADTGICRTRSHVSGPTVPCSINKDLLISALAPHSNQAPPRVESPGRCLKLSKTLSRVWCFQLSGAFMSWGWAEKFVVLEVSNSHPPLIKKRWASPR